MKIRKITDCDKKIFERQNREVGANTEQRRWRGGLMIRRH